MKENPKFEFSGTAIFAAGGIATLLGATITSIFSVIFGDASTQRATDVKLLELAIGILTEKDPNASLSEIDEHQLRLWAVNTINSVSEVKLNEQTAQALVQYIDRPIYRDRPVYVPVPINENTFTPPLEVSPNGGVLIPEIPYQTEAIDN